MSRVAHKEQTQASSSHHFKRSQKAVQLALDQLDDKLQKLKDNIIPPQPYLLSIPTDCPYRFHKSFINYWYAGTPFEPHEEELQYMSFHPHQNIGEELLRVEGGWSDADGNLVQDGSPSHSQDNHAPKITAESSAARKKISLKDYKVKDKASHRTPIPGTAPTSSQGTMKVDSTINNSRVEEKGKLHRDADRKHAEDSTRSVKPNKTATPIIREPNSPSPPKRRRLSSEEAKSGDSVARSSKHNLSTEKRHLPDLLSPTLPASKAGKTAKGLPDLLSPDLPKTLQIALAEVQPKRSDHVKAVLGEALGSLTDKRAAEKASSESGRVRSDSQLSSKSLPIGSKSSPLLNAASKPSVKASAGTLNGVRSSPGPRQRHVIALKYGKKNRKRVEMLLRFPPKPKKIRLQRDESPSRRSLDVTHESHRNAITPVKLEKKRPPEPSPDRAVKKLKTTGDTPNRPRTPTVSIKTPGHASSARKLDPQITPKRELKPSATAMQRVASSDGMDAKTPPIDRARTSTPVNAVTARSSPVASSTPVPRESERAAWHEVNTKYHKLGKELKTEAQRLAPSNNEMDQILSVMNHIEALLCFMINLSAQSHSRTSGSGWETIMPYFIAVFKASRRYRHLHGLVIQLGAVCRQVWHGHNIEKLYREPLPDESLNSAPTPGSDGNTRTDDTEKYKKRYLDFKNQLVENSRELQKAWFEGSRHLSLHLLQQEYPRTWSRSAKDTLHRSSEKINPTKIGKDFFLPLDPNSTVFEAARFAMSLMEEWAEKENVSWKAKIDL